MSTHHYITIKNESRYSAKIIKIKELIKGNIYHVYMIDNIIVFNNIISKSLCNIRPYENDLEKRSSLTRGLSHR